MAHSVIESLVMAYPPSPNTSELILRDSDGGCHSKGSYAKFHSRLKSESFDSKKYHAGI